jgi:uncharacterized protein (TIGR04442 family)
LDIRELREEIKEATETELAEEGLRGGLNEIFEEVFLDLKKEAFYLSKLLPLIVRDLNVQLREDFISNSGLDRFYIENLEKDYFEENSIDLSRLNLIREEKENEKFEHTGV